MTDDSGTGKSNAKIDAEASLDAVMDPKSTGLLADLATDASRECITVNSQTGVPE